MTDPSASSEEAPDDKEELSVLQIASGYKPGYEPEDNTIGQQECYHIIHDLLTQGHGDYEVISTLICKLVKMRVKFVYVAIICKLFSTY